jgi:hypothetical protein
MITPTEQMELKLKKDVDNFYYEAPVKRAGSYELLQETFQTLG